MIGYIVCGAVACAAVLCMAFSQRLKLRRYDIPTDKLNGGLRIVQISDLHDCRFGKRQERLIGMVRDASPDLIVLTGDIVNDTPELTARRPILSPDHPARELLDGILPLAPVYMVFGNHEDNIAELSELKAELNELGVKLIGGKRGGLSVKGQRIELCGIDDPRFFGQGKQKMSLRERIADDSERTSQSLERWRHELAGLEGQNDGSFSVLLSHRPEEYGLYGDFDLTFSGHAHGGQWRLPPIINGVYAPHQGIFPKHAGGLYKLDKGWHIVSRGLSVRRCPRIFNRPEVCLAVINGDKR